MNRHRLIAFSFLFCTFFVCSCASPPVKSPFQAKDLNLMPFSKKVDTFFVILDDSASMNEAYKGKKKAIAAKEILVGMNQTIPDISVIAGLRTFGDQLCPVTETTRLVYGLTGYSKTDFESAVQHVGYPSGRSPLAKAIHASSDDLKSQKGRIAVIIVTDGDNQDNGPLLAAQDLKKSYGQRLCIYTILMGNNPSGKALLEKIAQAGACGIAVTAEDISSAEGMATFVTTVFLETAKDSDKDGVQDSQDKCPNTPKGVPVDNRGCPLDADKDGVYDYKDRCPGTPEGVTVDRNGCPADSDHDGIPDFQDRCPNTPSGAPVDKHGCPLDSDGDGVFDYLDQCPGTPKGARVNEKGCWIIGGPSLDAGNVLFDTAQASIKPAAYPVLDETVAVLKNNPALRVEIQGHTDNVGRADYNRKLSEKRAKSVLEYLVSKGIDRNRLTAAGYGLTKPIASNETQEGRALNRRVELKPLP